ncbi:MAG: hypothetical protein ACE5L6_05335 [Candidatus Bathyarchaeia archaeon]
MTYRPNKQVVRVSKERPQLKHVAIGLVVAPLFIFALRFMLAEPALVSITIFNLMFVLLTFPLKGSLSCKVLWLGLGNLAGSAWNLTRLSLISVTAELASLRFLHFVTGPAVDFLWIVPVWSVGLSMLASTERRKLGGEEG